jgi:hypothetical protein
MTPPGDAELLSLLQSDEVGDPGKEANCEYREADESDDLFRAYVGERENSIRLHAISCSVEINLGHVHGELGDQEDQVQSRDRQNDPHDQHLPRLLRRSHRQLPFAIVSLRAGMTFLRIAIPLSLIGGA